MVYTRETIIEQLKNNEVVVTFTKINGDERVMTCTLQDNKLPTTTKKDPLSQKKLRDINEKVVSVWDLNAEGWRSFRVDNVTDMKNVEDAHQELVDTLANKTRYYNVRVYGYGGEAAYMELNKAQYDFWAPVIEEYGDSDAINYCVNAEDGEFEFDDITDIPASADFLMDSEGEGRSPWYEAPYEFEHQWGVDFNNASICIDEVDSEEYNAQTIKEVVDSIDLSEWVDEMQEKHSPDYTTEIWESVGSDGQGDEPPYVLQFWSAEKGTFFEGTIATKGEFDPIKLKINTCEYLNGDETLQSIEYDGEEIDNGGGDTTGKGYSVHVWKNV
tara:strand:- start:2053 stop:3039 length:987 start_codon:yes stop_codon:yes gene_type:complete